MSNFSRQFRKQEVANQDVSQVWFWVTSILIIALTLGYTLLAAYGAIELFIHFFHHV